MKRLLLLTLLAAGALSLAQRTQLEVKELSSSEVSALEVLRQKEEDAQVAIERAVAFHDQAQKDLGDMEKDIAAKFKPWEGACSGGKAPMRTVIVQGKYAMISEFSIPCGQNGKPGRFLFTSGNEGQ